MSTVVDFLRNQGHGYRVESPDNNAKTQRMLDFVRNLYNNHGRSSASRNNDKDDNGSSDDESPQLVSKSVAANAVRRKNNVHIDMQKAKIDEEEQLELLAGDEILPYHDNGTTGTTATTAASLMNSSNHLWPFVPSDVPVELLTIDVRLGDCSAKDAVLRCLQAYLDILSTTTMTSCATTTSPSRVAAQPPLLTQEHLDVFREMPIITDTSKLDFFVANKNSNFPFTAVKIGLSR